MGRGMAPDRSCAASPWLVVAGGLHRRGGMDRANAALAEYLLGLGRQVHIVAHEVDDAIARHPQASVYLVPRRWGSFMMGEIELGRKGREVATWLSSASPGSRVVVNGSNCPWPDVNWVHCVHKEWNAFDPRAPVWFKVKNRADRVIARRREATALRRAGVVVANSRRTRSILVNRLGVDSERVHTLYPGTDPALVPPTEGERRWAREHLGVSPERPLVVFIGTLGFDSNKGFDTLMNAWRRLCARAQWDADLIAAGGGRGSERWKAEIARARLDGRIRMLGFTQRVADLLAAADLLVSPARYEAYGLNVQEAICRGVPAMVSACAGVAERYPCELRELLIENPGDSNALAVKLSAWRNRIGYWKGQILPTAQMLHMNTWERMGERFVSIAEQSKLEFNSVRYG